ncbi:zinc ABC transporter substrate-binding protein [Dinoroseobacter sp. S375]|uniref:zinc ABC transporter substrate-binding protein n=1 Tax=Dinoroseobacter sp. S375 TaxID=3415136 RepID=UPI003C7D7065
MSRMLLPLSLSAALLGGTAVADAPSVAADIAPVHSLVARVMAGVGSPDLVIPAGASPHQYNLRPSEAKALQDADLVFWLGEDLTPWLEDAVDTLAATASVTALLEAEGTILHDFREGALFEAHDHGDEEHGHEEHADHEDHDHEHGHMEAKAEAHDHDHDHDEHAHDEHDHNKHANEDHAEHDHDEHDHEEHAEHDHDAHDHEDHAEHDHDKHDHEEHAGHDHDAHGHEGHDHGDHDPHAWLSPTNAATWLNVIAAKLSAADPENAGTYFANAAEARAEMDALITEVTAILEPVKGGRFISFHDAYQYFEMDFDFPASGAISLGDAADPSPARIAEVQGRVQNEGIQCVLAEPQFNPGLVTTVLDGSSANTAVIDPLGADLELGADLYPQMIRNMATALAGCF